jgi:hypothetical protein
VVAGACGDEAEQDRRRPGEIAREVERVRLKRGASVPLRGPIRDGGASRVDHDHHRDHHQRVPAWIDPAVREPYQAPERAPRDQEAHQHEDRRLRQRRQVLGLAVTVGMPRIGRPACDPDRDEGEDRRDQVGPGMGRLGKEAEAVRRDAGDELQPDQRTGGDHGDERSAALGAHPAKDRTERRKGSPRVPG